MTFSLTLALKVMLASGMLSCSSPVTAGCATHESARSGDEILDDSAITTRVKSALIADGDVNADDIVVTTFKRTVQLSGFADSRVQADKAVEVAAAVNGVRRVNHNLVPRP